MSAIIPFDSNLPALPSTKRLSGINRDILGSGAPSFPVLSIKGKVFTLVKGSEKKILTRDVDGEEMAVQSLQVTVARANTKYRVFYATAFNDGESDGKKPTCYSTDGIAPASNAVEPQSKKCNGCPQNVWGVRDGKGFACTHKTRLAIVDPNNLDEPAFLLNVPPASRASWMQAVEAADTRGQDYNRMVLRLSFDKEAATPKLQFKPAGWLSEDAHEQVSKMFDSEIIKEMLGVTEVAPVPAVDADDVAAALEAPKAAAPKVAPKAAPVAPSVDADDIEDVVVKPAKAAAAPKPAAKKPVAPKPAVEDDDAEDLLASIENMLGDSDD